MQRGGTVNFQGRVIIARSIQSISIAVKDMKVRVLNGDRTVMTQSDWFLKQGGASHGSVKRVMIDLKKLLSAC